MLLEIPMQSGTAYNVVSSNKEVTKRMEEAFFKEGNDVGVLVIHGFTGSPGSMRDLAQFYADQGFTVALPRLAGHGTTPEDLEKRKYQEWIEDVEKAYQWLKSALVNDL